MSKTIPLDYYRDPADTECLNEQYYEDNENFAELPRKLQFLHLGETIAEYGKETLKGDQLVAAKDFGFITDHSSTDNSWLATAANVVASVPKGVVFFASVGAVLQAAGAYRIVQNALDNFGAENSDTVHHRSARAAGNVKLLTLPNDNCMGAEMTDEAETMTWNKKWSYAYTHCFNTPCGKEYTETTKTYHNWYHEVFGLNIQRGNDDETGEVTFSYFSTTDMSRHKGTITSTCNLPLSPYYESFKECKDLKDSNDLVQASQKCHKSLAIMPNFSEAIELQGEILKLLSTTISTTAKPSSSHTATKEKIITETSSSPLNISTLITSSLTAKDSTLTETSTSMVEANTTQMEPNPAPFEEEAVPTSMPQNQSSYSSQGWMDTKLGQTIVGSLSALVLGSTLKVIHHCWMKTHPESQGVLSYFRSKCFSKPTEDLEQKDEKSYLPLLTITDNVLKNDDSAVPPIGENPTNVDTNTLEL